MKHISQRSDTDCGLAALAMVADTTMEKVAEALFGDAESDLSVSEAEAVLFLYRHVQGCHPLWVRRELETDPDLSGARISLPTTADVLNMIAGKRALILTKVIPGVGGHWLAWCNDTVDDPAGEYWDRERLLEEEIRTAIILI